MTVSVLTDSAASLPPERARVGGIAVVPFNITFHGRTHLDTQTLLSELEARSISEDVSTSAPSPGTFAEVIDDQDEGDGVVVITVASTMSASHQSAALAGRHFDAGRVRVVDSGTAAGAQGLVVLAAARRAAMGADVEEVAAAAHHAASKVRLIATVDNLEYLARSGRVPTVAARAGDTLGVRALFEFSAGRARPLRPAMGIKAAMDRIASLTEQPDGMSGTLRVAVLHARAGVLARRLRDKICSLSDPGEMFIAPFSTVMTAHAGPGLVGAAWWHDDTSKDTQWRRIAS